MKTELDPGLLAFAGSKTRVLALGVLADAERPMTGYRVAKTAGLAPIKVYGELRKAMKAGTVEKVPAGFVLVDSDLRSYLARKVPIFWSGDLVNSSRADRAARAKALPTDWYDPSRYVPNPEVAKRYDSFFRPPEKDQMALRTGVGLSRKRK